MGFEAICHLKSIRPVGFGRQTRDRKPDETHEEYDLATWKEKASNCGVTVLIFVRKFTATC